jgi:hypothetical protein
LGKGDSTQMAMAAASSESYGGLPIPLFVIRCEGPITRVHCSS